MVGGRGSTAVVGLKDLCGYASYHSAGVPEEHSAGLQVFAYRRWYGKGLSVGDEFLQDVYMC